MNLHPLDVVFLVLVAVAAIRCTFRGFITEVLSMAAILLGIAGAVVFSKYGATLIDEYVGYSSWNQVVAFLIIFLLVYLIVKLVEKMLHRILEKIHLDRLDRALGFFLGLAEGALAVILIVHLLQIQPVIDLGETLDKSVVSRFVLDLVPTSAGGAIDIGRDTDV